MVENYSIPSWVSDLTWKDKSRLDAAVAFLRGITKDDHVAVLYDDDGDGLSAAAAVVVGITRLRGRPPELLRPFGHSTTYVDELLPQKLQAEGITKLITVDRAMDQMSGSLPEFVHRLETICPVLVIDHHKLYHDHSSPRYTLVKPQIVWETESSNFPTAMLAYTLFSMVTDLSDKDWIPCIGITSDSSYPRWKKFVDASAEKWGLDPVKDDPFEAPFGVMSGMIYCTQILSSYQLPELLDLMVEANHPNLVLNSGFRSLISMVDEEVNEWLERLKTEMQLFPEIELALASIRPRHAVKSLIINKLSRERFANWNLVILQDVANGTRVTLSARRQDFKVPMNELLEFAVKGFSEANAGGHIPAAGGLIRKEDEEKFIENVKTFLRAHYQKKH